MTGKTSKVQAKLPNDAVNENENRQSLNSALNCQNLSPKIAAT